MRNKITVLTISIVTFLNFTALSAFAATQADVANWLVPLVGTHTLNGDLGCKSVSIENIEEKNERFVTITLSSDTGGMMIYDARLGSDQNCVVKTDSSGNNMLVCDYSDPTNAVFESFYSTGTNVKVALSKDSRGNLNGLHYLSKSDGEKETLDCANN